MKRRLFVGGLAGTLGAQREAARAQQVQGRPLIGFLHPGFPDFAAPSFKALHDGLREAGYTDGGNVRIEARWGLGKPEALPQLAQELIRLRATVLVPIARSSIEAARAATVNVPIIATDLESDPVASGYVASLAHPGANLTGFFLDAPALCGKWLQQIREIVPGVKDFAVLWDSTTGPYQVNAMKAAATEGSTSILEFSNSTELESVLDVGLKKRPPIVVQLGSPLIRQAGARIAELLLVHRIPGISPFRTFTDAGGLISYGPDLPDLYRRLGIYVAKVLKGARPGNLPIERPSKFEMVVNLKTAKTLQLTIPAPIISNADDVIE